MLLTLLTFDFFVVSDYLFVSVDLSVVVNMVESFIKS